MKQKSKTRFRKNGFFVLMLVINIGMAIYIFNLFGFYANKNAQDMYDAEIKVVTSGVDEAVGQMNALLYNGDYIAKKYAEYIEEEKLSEQETIRYLQHWMDFYAEVDIVSAKTQRGISLVTTQNGSVSIFEKSFENVEGVTWLIQHYDLLEKRKINIQTTDFIKTDCVDEPCFAYCQPITINGDNKILYFVVPASSLNDAISGSFGNQRRKGVLLDGKGNIMFGEIPVPDTHVGDNFFEEVGKYCGVDTRTKVEDFLKDGKGNYILKDLYGGEWLCVHGSIVGEQNWKYISYDDNKKINKQQDMMQSNLNIFLVMFIWLLMDITGYFIYNRMLINSLMKVDEQNRDLIAANQAKNMFISNMSHEIRTPINAVLGMDEMIIRETDNEQIKEYAYGIKNSGKVLLGIINDVLDYSKIESGKLEIIPDEYDLGSVVNDLCNIIYLKTKEKNLELVLDVDSKTPHLLYGDEIRIKQVILNLLTNAVKYTEKGTVTLIIRYKNLEPDKIVLVVSVKDTGIGIKEEEMNKLCNAFERLDERRNKTIEGTGLGMSIVTRLLEQMGGQLTVESEYGKGSTFTIKIEQPVINADPVGDINDMKIRSIEESDETQTILRASKAKILAVDDTIVNLTVVRGLLKRTGVQVDTAESGAECLQMVSKKKYDIILLDHRMPQMDGIETLHYLKDMGEEISSIPVIALTANVVSGAYEMYMKAGFTDFLSKPVSGYKLERMLLKYLPEECFDSEDDIAVMIDDEAGISACGSKEIHYQVVEEFATVYKKNSDEIKGFFDAKDIENYTIKVHALKSSARLVGANNLSKEALELEKCGNEGKWDTIAERTPILLKHYGMVVENLKEMLGIDTTQDDKEEIDDSELKEALKTIMELNEAFDFDSIDKVMESIGKYKLPEEYKELYEKLKVAVYDFDQEEIRKLFENA